MRLISRFFLISLIILSLASLSIFVVPSFRLADKSKLAKVSFLECEAGYEKCAVLGEDSSFCGDGSCDGFENCSSCEIDCGACPDNFAWWQTWGGHTFAGSDAAKAIGSYIPDSDTCIEPSCFPFLSSLDRFSSPGSDGFVMTGGGNIIADGWLTYREPNVFVMGTQNTRLQETYSFFYKQYSLGFAPVDHFYNTAFDAQKPTEVWEVYFREGDMIIQNPWHINSGESFVILIDGNLLIEDPGAVGELITVDEGGFLAFIASGNIVIDESVGHSNLSNMDANIEGVYVADGDLTILSNEGMDKKFVGEGVFVGWSRFFLNRDFNGGVENDLYPTETFIYRPDFMKNVPQKMMRSQMLRQEV